MRFGDGRTIKRLLAILLGILVLTGLTGCASAAAGNKDILALREIRRLQTREDASRLLSRAEREYERAGDLLNLAAMLTAGMAVMLGIIFGAAAVTSYGHRVRTERGK